MATRPPISNQATINLRLDASLKASLLALAEAENLTASELVRDLIDERLRRSQERKLREEIQRQCRLIDQSEDEKEVMRWLEGAIDLGEWE